MKSNRTVSLCRVVTGAITAYVSGTQQPASVDTQGNLLVSIANSSGAAVGGIGSGATQMPLITSLPFMWQIFNTPAVNTVATATKAAGGAGVRHVATGFTVGLNLFAALVAPLTIQIRDGASGVGTVLFETRISANAIFPALSGLSLLGTANTAMTIEFTAAPGATNFANVWLQGYSVALA